MSVFQSTRGLMTYGKKKKKNKAMTPERIDELLRQDQEKARQHAQEAKAWMTKNDSEKV